MQDLVIIDS